MLTLKIVRAMAKLYNSQDCMDYAIGYHSVDTELHYVMTYCGKFIDYGDLYTYTYIVVLHTPVFMSHSSPSREIFFPTVFHE